MRNDAQAEEVTQKRRTSRSRAAVGRATCYQQSGAKAGENPPQTWLGPRKDQQVETKDSTASCYLLQHVANLHAFKARECYHLGRVFLVAPLIQGHPQACAVRLELLHCARAERVTRRDQHLAKHTQTHTPGWRTYTQGYMEGVQFKRPLHRQETTLLHTLQNPLVPHGFPQNTFTPQ